MADLKLGTTLGGAGIWSASNLPLLPSGGQLTYKGWRVYTENDRPTAEDIDALSTINGGTVAKNTTFNQNLVVGASLTANLIQSNSVLTIQRSANPAEMIFYRPDITTTPSSEAWVLNMYAKDGLNRNMGSLIISARTDGGNKVYLRANKDGSPNTSLTLDSQTQQITVEQGSFRVIGTTNLGVTNAASIAVSGAITANTVTPSNWANHDERYITGIPRGMYGNSFGAAVVTEKNDVLSVGGNITDGPYGNTTYYGQVVNYRRTLNSGVSLVQTYFGNEMWFRLGTGSPGAWSWNHGNANGWRRVYDTVTPPTPAEVGAVNKAGDTMTGGLALLGDLTFRNLVNRHIRFEYTKNDGSTAVDAYIYKDGVDSSTRRAGLRINCGTPNKASGNTSNSGDFVFGENGNFTLPGGGMIIQDGLNQGVYCMSALSTTASGSKNYLRKFRGGNSDTIWHETVQGGTLRWATGNTDAQECMRLDGTSLVVQGNITSGNNFLAGGIMQTNGGSLYIRSSGGTHTWYQEPDGSERAVTWADGSGIYRIRSNNNKAATWEFKNGMIYYPAPVNGSDHGLIRGVVDAGGWDQWTARSAGVMLDVPNIHVSAYNIWKVTKWGTSHVAAMDIHRPSDNDSQTRVRIITNSGAYFYFNGSGEFTASGNGSFNDVYIRSDEKLKSNFNKIENALDKVELLNGMIYDKADHIGGEPTSREAGLIAQQLQSVLPEAVKTGEDTEGNEILTVSPTAAIALLVNAVKELREEVRELKSR